MRHFIYKKRCLLLLFSKIYDRGEKKYPKKSCRYPEWKWYIKGVEPSDKYRSDNTSDSCHRSVEAHDSTRMLSCILWEESRHRRIKWSHSKWKKYHNNKNKHRIRIPRIERESERHEKESEFHHLCLDEPFSHESHEKSLIDNRSDPDDSHRISDHRGIKMKTICSILRRSSLDGRKTNGRKERNSEEKIDFTCHFPFCDFFGFHFWNVLFWLRESINNPKKIQNNNPCRNQKQSFDPNRFRKNSSECWSDKECHTKGSSHHSHIFRPIRSRWNIRNIGLYDSETWTSDSSDKSGSEIDEKSRNSYRISELECKVRRYISDDINGCSRKEEIFPTVGIWEFPDDRTSGKHTKRVYCHGPHRPRLRLMKMLGDRWKRWYQEAHPEDVEKCGRENQGKLGTFKHSVFFLNNNQHSQYCFRHPV